MAGSVGILWEVPSLRASWGSSRTRLPSPIPSLRANFQLTPAATTTSDLTDRFIDNVIVEHEYEHFPHGRIVYHKNHCQFILYADRRLQQYPTLAAIAGNFGLWAASSFFTLMNITEANAF